MFVVLQAIFTASPMVEWPRRGRSSVEPRRSRWRPPVFACTTAHESESLRTRHVGGRLPRLVGALRPPAGLLDEGATRATCLMPPARNCSAFYPLLPALRCLAAVLLVVAEVLGPSPRHRRKRNQPGLAESSRITLAVVQPRSA